MPRFVRLAALQLPGWTTGTTAREKHECNLRNMEHHLTLVGRAGCDLAAIGENSNLRTLNHAERVELANPLLDGAEMSIGRRLAREFKMNVCLGIGGIHNGKRRNAAVFIDRNGAVAGTYFKVHLTRWEAHRGTAPGDDFPVFDLDIGRVGAVICHDLSYVESTRVLTVRRAEIIVWPSNWAGDGRDLADTVIRCRAIDSSAHLMFMSYGQDPTQPMEWQQGVVGCTSIINPLGEVIAQAPHRTPCVVTAEVDLDLRRVSHNFTYDRDDVWIDEMLSERRPQTYGPICDPGLVPPPPRRYTFV